MGDRVERDLNERRNDIGHQHLLGEADDEDPGAHGRPAQCEPAGVQLPGDGLVANDWSRNQLREQGNVERDVDRVAIGPEPPAVDVDDVGEAMEGEKRDAERKRDVRLNDGAPSGLSSVVRLAVMKLAYLKIPSSSRFPATATPRANRRDDPSRASIKRAAQN